MWGCGLKLLGDSITIFGQFVTPYVGVWIEIYSPTYVYYVMIVTPYVGVWIEICSCGGVSAWRSVTPYVGVWIEIMFRFCLALSMMSPPMWGCGLKLLAVRCVH